MKSLEARVSVYERRGNYQIYVNKMELDGRELVSKVRTIKAKLKRRLFNNEHKSLFLDSLKIAILTASTGAAIRDIQSTINSRYPLAEKSK